MSDLAKAQFDFYARDLQNGNPYSDQAQADTVEHARDYLSRFSGNDRVYQALLAEAARKGNTIIFNRDYPGSERVMRNTYPVPARFHEERLAVHESTDRRCREDGSAARSGCSEKAAGRPLPIGPQPKKDLADKYLADYIATGGSLSRTATSPDITAWRMFPANLASSRPTTACICGCSGWSRPTPPSIRKSKLAFQPAHVVEVRGFTGVDQRHQPRLHDGSEWAAVDHPGPCG